MDCYFARRFPGDPYDRLWERRNSSLWAYLSTEEAILHDNRVFAVPIPVLRTAIAPINNTMVLNVSTWESYKTSFEFMVVLHFTDFQNNQLRQFDLFINNEPLYFQYSPIYLTASWVYSTQWHRATDSKYTVTLAATNVSVLPPMINAYEIYYLIHHDTPRTSSGDCELSLHLFLSAPLPHSCLMYCH